jgi:hypothetical protein
MKLKREEFNVLIPPCRSGRRDQDGPKITGVEPIEILDGDSEDSDGNGEDELDIGGLRVKVKKVTQNGIIGETNIGEAPGTMITPEDSKKLQESLGVPVELPEPGDDEKYAQEARRHIDKLTSGDAGSGKGSLRRAVMRLTEPIVDWKSALRRFIGKAMSSTEQYLGSRRHLYKDDYFYAEKRKYEALETAVVAVDTSGSMSPKAIELILSETRGIIKAKKIKKTQVVYFDHGIQDIDHVGEKSIFDYSKAKGGGGTSFTEPLQYMEQQYKKNKMNLAVFMTDGYADLNLPTPKWQNIFVWVILDNPSFRAPFGNLVVHISRSQMQDA